MRYGSRQSSQLSSASQGRGTGEGEATDPRDIWSALPTARPDPASRVSAAYNADASSSKIDLSLPGFREDSGKPFLPPTVRHAEKQLRNAELFNRDALPVWGDERFLAEGIKFAYGSDHAKLKLENIAAIQASTLTGALRLAGTFLSRFSGPSSRSIYLPSPTTEEDTSTLRDAGLDIRHYRYLDRKTGAVDFDGLQADLQAAPARSVVMLYVSGSVPTGVDLSDAQWRMITTILQERSLIPLVVLAFQGLATGDAVKDAQPLRLMAQEGLPVVLCQSFDAMMGLYSDSPSILSVVSQSPETKSRVDSQLRAVARGMHVHPSPWGAHIAHVILSDAKLHPAWLNEIKAMSGRLRSVRDKLYDLLANKFKTPGNWIHIKRSVGLYCTTLLSPIINDILGTKRHIYLLPHGSFSLGSLNSLKIEQLARSIDSAVLASIHEAEQVQAQQLAMELALAAAKEAAAREEAEALAADQAREEDRMLMENSIASAIEAQRRAEEEERDREEEERRRMEEDLELDQAVRKAAERAQIARQAEAILASIGAGMG
ncbi:pyridoxal phosphate-dependent transferase [Kockovaella imperatae]|uniref:Pyridoxal phosphate-dependent transferase n=1 Tax=Kockovaella imperatae TaxID=4999 RepID=A0A1Y1UK49_9TREE|nr:pyridoxal phosphate-dependent transferase [Kockovaella imperatae]ORX37874.1 pyridoxal phosphate-dependent transferase [Kockovaella imperatae]